MEKFNINNILMLLCAILSSIHCTVYFAVFNGANLIYTICFFLGTCFIMYKSIKEVYGKYYERNYSTIFKLKVLSISFFLSIVTNASFMSFRNVLNIESYTLYISVMIGTVIALTIFFAFMVMLMYSYSCTFEQQKETPSILYFSLPFFLINILYFKAYYPGIMNTDSVNQWQQAHSNVWNDWHPVIHTLLIKICSLVYDNPSSFIFFQIIICSLIMEYVFSFLYKIASSKKLILFSMIFILVFPMYSLSTVYMVKDSLFSYILLLYTVEIILIIHSKGKWLDSKKNILLYFTTVFLFVFLRHNGWPAFLLTAFLFAIVFRQKNYLKVHFVAILVIVLHFVITGPVFDYFRVVPSDSTEALGILVQIDGGIITNNGQMDEREKDLMFNLMSEEDWNSQYNPTLVDSIKFSGNFDKQYLKDNKESFLLTSLQLMKNNPFLTSKAYLSQTQLVWRANMNESALGVFFKDKAFDSMRPIYFMSQEQMEVYKPIYEEFNYKDYGTYNTFLHDLLKKVQSLFEKHYIRILFMPAVFLIMLVLFMLIILLKGNGKYLFSAIPFLLITGSMLVALPAQDSRYMLPNYLLIFVYLFLSIMRIDTKKK